MRSTYLFLCCIELLFISAVFSHLLVAVLLSYCSTDEDVVRETLDVFDALSLNYSTSNELANLDEVRAFLQANNVAIGSTVTSSSAAPSGTVESKLMAGPLASSTLLITDLAFLNVSRARETAQKTEKGGVCSA